MKSNLWWFSAADWGHGDKIRFSEPVTRAVARAQVLNTYGWDRLPHGSELSAY